MSGSSAGVAVLADGHCGRVMQPGGSGPSASKATRRTSRVCRRVVDVGRCVTGVGGVGSEGGRLDAVERSRSRVPGAGGGQRCRVPAGHGAGATHRRLGTPAASGLTRRGSTRPAALLGDTGDVGHAVHPALHLHPITPPEREAPHQAPSTRGFEPTDPSVIPNPLGLSCIRRWVRVAHGGTAAGPCSA
jgi:hypothetical protein